MAAEVRGVGGGYRASGYWLTTPKIMWSQLSKPGVNWPLNSIRRLTLFMKLLTLIIVNFGFSISPRKSNCILPKTNLHNNTRVSIF